MTLELVLEYVAGFSFGLFIFQALFMKLMVGGRYLAAVRRTIFPEWVSMNGLMAGMIPVMVSLMTAVPAAADPVSLRFWGVMSAAVLVGAIAAYPVNIWLVARGLKHGMGTARALGRGGHSMEVERRIQRRAVDTVSDRMRRSPAGGEGGEDHRRVTPGRVEIALVAVATVLALGIGVLLATPWAA